MGSRSSIHPDRNNESSHGRVHDSVRRAAPAGAVGRLIRTLERVEQELAAEQGPFTLFCLVQREESNKWDVIVAAPWIGDNLRFVLETLVGKVKSVGGTAALLEISRFVPLTSRDEFVRAIRDNVSAEHDLVEMPPDTIGRIDIARGYIITSKPRRAAKVRR